MFDIKYISVFVILFSVLSLLIIFTLPRLKKQQKNAAQSLKEGFGYYSKEQSLKGCITQNSGKCTDEGIEQTIQYCKPHPVTGRGCIDENGMMSYKTIITSKPCRLQCFSSDFSIQDGVKVTNPRENYEGTSFGQTLSGLGCDKIIDRELGIDYTNYFLGDLVVQEEGNFQGKAKYQLKNCIPDTKNSMFESYYQRILRCDKKDGKGVNLCTYTCGEGNQNILNLSGFAETSNANSLLNYFPSQISEDGSKVYFCNDINDKNQIEVLNYSEKVPDDFVYPNRCYRHTNVFDFTENIWPTQSSKNVFTLNKEQVSYNVSYIDIRKNQYENFNIITDPIVGILTNDYDLSKNYDNYVKLRFGDELALLDKIYKPTVSGIEVINTRKTEAERDKNNIESKFLYLSLKAGVGGNIKNLLNILSSDGGFEKFKNFTEVLDDEEKIFNDDNFFTTNQEIYKNSYMFIEKDSDYLYFPCNFYEFFLDVEGETNIISSGVSTFLSNEAFGVTGNFYYYMVNEGISTRISQVKFAKGSVDGTKRIATFNSKLFDSHNTKLKGIYQLRADRTPDPITNELQIKYDLIQEYFIDYNKIFAPFNVVMNQFQEAEQAYQVVNINDKEVINEERDVAYTVLGSNKSNDTRIDNITGYYYPLYLETSGDISNEIRFYEIPNLIFYYSDLQYSLKNPEYYREKTLTLFNDSILFSSASYQKTYINIEDKKKYFISELNTINNGMSYQKNGKFNRVYPLFSSQGTSIFNNLQNNLNSNTENNQITNSIVYKGDGDYKGSISLKIIRGNSLIVSNYSTAFIGQFSEIDEKIKLYYEMIRFQDFTKDVDENLVIEPEKNVTFLANYEEFKSPYTYNSDGNKNFVCFDDFGKALPSGTKKEFTINDSLYINIKCPNSNVGFEIENDENPYCGFKGVKLEAPPDESGDDQLLNFCVQDRNLVEINFTGSTECIVSKNIKEYNNLNDQFSSGFELRDIKKSVTKEGMIDPTVRTFSSFFTKNFEEGKLYEPKEEFYTEKIKNNYYISLEDNNDKFVKNKPFWKRSYIYDSNILVSTGQAFFSNFPSFTTKNIINLTLGKFSSTYEDLNTENSLNLNNAFNTETTGLTTQHYINQGIMPYWGHQRKPLYFNKIPFDSYIESLLGSLYRKKWDSDTFTSTPSDAIAYGAVGQKPSWDCLKLSKNAENGSLDKSNLKLDNLTPNLITFSILELESNYVFSSRFYDSNLNIPWATDVEVGDYFSPDFIYFNTFIYSFILSGLEYTSLGNDPVDLLLEPYFLRNNTDGSNIFSEGFIYESGTKINVAVDAPIEKNNFILLIPFGFDKDSAFDFANFPVRYPTLRILKVLDVSDVKVGDEEKILTLDTRNYSGYESKIPEGDPQFYIFNLGNSISENNFINRKFLISDINTYRDEIKEGIDEITYYTLEKKYIEFIFTIDSISYEDMSRLFTEFKEDRRSETLNLVDPNTFLTPSISCKYIKSQIEIPYQEISLGLYANLSSTTEQNILKTKVMSQSTSIRLKDKLYYINEFRENSDYFTPTQDLTFEIGDVFDYYSSIIYPFNGNNAFQKVLTLRVIDTEVTLEEGNNFNIYDYKCVNVNGTIGNPFEDDKNSIEEKRIGGTTVKYKYKSFYLYIKSVDYEGNDDDWEYQLTHTLYHDGKIYNRVMVDSINSDFTLNCRSTTFPENNDFILSAAPTDKIFLDYYKFSTPGLSVVNVEEPAYNIPDGGEESNLINLYGAIDGINSGPLYSLGNSTVYTGSAIRAGLLDTMVLTKTNVRTENNTQNFSVSVDVKGKPYGPAYFLSQPGASPMINYQAFGKITRINFDDIGNVSQGKVLKSTKGFEIKVTNLPPTSYSFQSITNPYNAIEVYENDYSYLKNSLVYLKNNNTRQYFRNNSKYIVPYMENPTIKNQIVPYSVKNEESNRWTYPLYLENPTGEGEREEITINDTVFYYDKGVSYSAITTDNLNPSRFIEYNLDEQEKLDILENFETIPRTFFPEDNFLIYDSNSSYTFNQIVVGRIDASGDKGLFKSLKKII